MIDPDIQLWAFYRPGFATGIEKHHAAFMAAMAEIGPPLGFAGLPLPPVPEFGPELATGFFIKPAKNVRCIGSYHYRTQTYGNEDKGSNDDNVRWGFYLKHYGDIYPQILHAHFPGVIEAYQAYRATISMKHYALHYRQGDTEEKTELNSRGEAVMKNEVYNRLSTDSAGRLNGRSNIFTLEPAHFWDAELCRRALGYDRDEVIRRLDGKVPLVRPLMDGVYVVFNDDIKMTYQEFLAVNATFKPILGLI